MNQRWTAYKVNIQDILTAALSNDNPQGFTDNTKRVLYRVNLIASVVEKIETTANLLLILDDGTGKITVRFFEPEKVSIINVGEIVMCIGRIREFNNERYIVGEIIKPQKTEWIKIRKLEVKPAPLNEEARVIEEDVETLYIQVIDCIGQLDTGVGADYKEILVKMNNPLTYKTINKLLELGEIFEIKPGKFKVMK